MDISASELAELVKELHDQLASLEYRGEIDAEKIILDAVQEKFDPMVAFLKVLAQTTGYGFQQGGNGMMMLVRHPGDFGSRLDDLTARIEKLENKKSRSK